MLGPVEAAAALGELAHVLLALALIGETVTALALIGETVTALALIGETVTALGLPTMRFALRVAGEHTERARQREIERQGGRE